MIAAEVTTIIDRHQSKELLRFLTCGSVDDGKSTLIGRLLHDTQTIYEDQLAAIKRDSAKVGTVEGGVDLALLTDGLKAEREQGITIDVAYRYFATEKRKFIIADTPGHEQYTRNMATGASTCQLAIILIDARHGVLTQTRRHSFIVSLLGIKHVVVAVNKMDLVGYAQEVFEAIQADYTGFIAKLGIPDVQFIPLSALKGDNVVEKSDAMPWYQGPPLLNHLETVHIASDRNLTEMRFPVQHVLRPNLDFRGLAGTVASGILRKGDPVLILPSGRHSRVQSIVTYDGELEEAFSPMSVAVTLADAIDVSRGDMLVPPDRPPHVSSQIEATVVWMGEKPFVPGRTYWIKQTTRLVSGEIAELRCGVDVNTLAQHPARQLAMNEVGQVQLSLNQPIAWDAYKNNPATGAFIIIDRLSNNTVGAGMILEPRDRGAEPGDHWGQTPAGRLHEHHGQVSLADRQARWRHRGATILITGLTGSGKATLAFALEKKLFDAGCAVTVLNAATMRMGLCRDLGFGADDRSENLRRSAEVAKLFNDAGMICIASFVAPHEAVRQKARQVIGSDRFLEVYLSAPLAVCRQRDKSGAYALADSGQILQFPGVSAVFEEPSNPELILPTHEIDVSTAVQRLWDLLKEMRFIHE
jgi:bifunctional enzyme CysN/CysC